MGEWKAAIAVGDDYLRVVPRASEVHVRRGDSLMMAGDYKAGLAAYARALELNPSDGHVYQNRGWLHKMNGQHAERCRDVCQIGLHLPAPEGQSGRFLRRIDVGIEHGRDRSDRAHPEARPGGLMRTLADR